MNTENKYRFGNLEFRRVESNYHPPYPAIVHWNKGEDNTEYCYTLARWVEGSEGWDLKFIGDLPFDSDKVDRRLFWELAQFGNTVVNAEWKLKQATRER